MTAQEIEQFIALIKSGKCWRMDIPEGFMEIYWEGGRIQRREYQTNPYSGERTNQVVDMPESDFEIYFKYYNAEEVMKCFN